MASNTLCDLCQSSEDVRHIDVRAGGRKHPMDLCAACAFPLEELLEEVAVARELAEQRRREEGHARSGKRNPSAGRFATLEDIERLKNQG